MKKARLIAAFQESCRKLQLDPSNVTVIGGATLVLRDLRESTADIDIVIDSSILDRLLSKVTPWDIIQDGVAVLPSGTQVDTYTGRFHDFELAALHPPQLVAFAGRTEIIDGITCASLESTLAYKKFMNRPKDQEDIRVIENHLKSSQFKSKSITGSELAALIVTAVRSGWPVGINGLEITPYLAVDVKHPSFTTAIEHHLAKAPLHNVFVEFSSGMEAHKTDTGLWSLVNSDIGTLYDVPELVRSHLMGTTWAKWDPLQIAEDLVEGTNNLREEFKDLLVSADLVDHHQDTFLEMILGATINSVGTDFGRLPEPARLEILNMSGMQDFFDDAETWVEHIKDTPVLAAEARRILLKHRSAGSYNHALWLFPLKNL